MLSPTIRWVFLSHGKRGSAISVSNFTCWAAAHTALPSSQLKGLGLGGPYQVVARSWRAHCQREVSSACVVQLAQHLVRQTRIRHGQRGEVAWNWSVLNLLAAAVSRGRLALASGLQPHAVSGGIGEPHSWVGWIVIYSLIPGSSAAAGSNGWPGCKSPISEGSI